MKTKITITIDTDLLEWLESQIKETSEFASVSHGINLAVFRMKKAKETKD